MRTLTTIAASLLYTYTHNKILPIRVIQPFHSFIHILSYSWHVLPLIVL